MILLLTANVLGLAPSPTLADMELLFRQLRKAQQDKSRPQLVTAWSSVLSALSEMRSPALLYFCELMYHDGIDLSSLNDKRLEVLLPPELNSDQDGKIFPRLQSLPRFSTRTWPEIKANHEDALNDLRFRGSPIRIVECFDNIQVAQLAIETARRDRVPVLLRGLGGSDWQEWDAEILADALPRAICRVATSSAVSFCRETHPLITTGIISAPSVAVSLIGKDAVFRLKQHLESEVVYLQALAPRSLLEKRRFDRFGKVFYSASDEEPPLPRIWACRGGVYSPLHYDAQDSILIQATGSKFIMLFPPTVLQTLDPVPDGHPLARRCQLDILRRLDCRHESDLPSVVTNSAIETQLLPGDAIWFPSEWAHHTVATSSDISISLSLREVDGHIVGA